MTAWDLGHIITNYVNQSGDNISHKKLQKLLYYVEAWNLVHLDKPLLDEDFEAWVHGPVIPALYHQLKEFGFNDLKVINEEKNSVEEEIDAIIKKNDLSENQLEIIYSVLNKYSSLSSLQLELLTHSESPWIEARKDAKPHEPCKNIIEKGRMKEYYASLIN